jgi:hypothetical protein
MRVKAQCDARHNIHLMLNLQKQGVVCDVRLDLMWGQYLGIVAFGSSRLNSDG